MKKILFVMLSAFLLTMVGSIPSSAKKIVVTKKVAQVDKTYDMRYLIGTRRGNLMSELGNRYWFMDVGDKVYCHDEQANHHWVFFSDGSYTITEAEPFHYVGRAFDPAEYMDWHWYELGVSTGPVEKPWQPTEDDIVIDYGQTYLYDVVKPGRVDLGTLSLQLIR